MCCNAIEILAQTDTNSYHVLWALTKKIQAWLCYISEDIPRGSKGSEQHEQLQHGMMAPDWLVSDDEVVYVRFLIFDWT